MIGERIIRVDSYDMKNKGIDLTTMILFPSADKKIADKKRRLCRSGENNSCILFCIGNKNKTRRKGDLDYAEIQ